MSEKKSGQNKTEAPTPKRLRDLRKQGQIPRSRDLPATVVIGTWVICMVLGGTYLLDGLRNILHRSASADFTTLADAASLLSWTKGLFVESVLLTLPIVLILVTVSAVSDFIQTGGVFSLEAVKPQLSRINPIEGIKRVFSLATLIELVKLLIKTAVLAAAVWFVIVYSLPTLLKSHWLPIEGILPLAFHVLSKLAWAILICFIAIAVFDLWFQRWNFIRRNRMTLEEVKRDHRESEGDPHIRSRRRQLHREVNEANMLENVRSATVIIVNPTHIAIALYYEAGETDLPVVVAKGEGNLAGAIRRIAEREGIPILQNVDLARRLQAGTQLNQYIPDEFIEPVAAVLRWARHIKETSQT